MRHGSLFSGIGGFDLAAEWMGWENVFHCEWNEFGKKVLKYYWPNAISYDDITQTDFTIHRGRIDVLTGGFPCQPYSTAGKRLGKEDERHLWPEMLRAIREIAPRYVVGENVRGLLSWNGGLVFDEVQADLEACGYEVIPFLLPACGVNAPHRRDRIWFVAHRISEEQREPPDGGVRSELGDGYWSSAHAEKLGHESSGYSRTGWAGLTDGDSGVNSNSTNKRLEGRGNSGQISRSKQASIKRSSNLVNLHEQRWENFPAQSPICYRNDGLSSRLDGITFPKWRNESIKAGGNAVVPQIPFQIFKAIDFVSR